MGPHHRTHQDPGEAADQDELQERPEPSVMYTLYSLVERVLNLRNNTGRVVMTRPTFPGLQRSQKWTGA